MIRRFSLVLLVATVLASACANAADPETARTTTTESVPPGVFAASQLSPVQAYCFGLVEALRIASNRAFNRENPYRLHGDDVRYAGLLTHEINECLATAAEPAIPETTNGGYCYGRYMVGHVNEEVIANQRQRQSAFDRCERENALLKAPYLDALPTDVSDLIGP